MLLYAQPPTGIRRRIRTIDIAMRPCTAIHATLLRRRKATRGGRHPLARMGNAVPGTAIAAVPLRLSRTPGGHLRHIRTPRGVPTRIPIRQLTRTIGAAMDHRTSAPPLNVAVKDRISGAQTEIVTRKTEAAPGR